MQEVQRLQLEHVFAGGRSTPSPSDVINVMNNNTTSKFNATDFGDLTGGRVLLHKGAIK